MSLGLKLPAVNGSSTPDGKLQPWKKLCVPTHLRDYQMTVAGHPDIRLQSQKDEHQSLGG